jgi:proline racemase
MAAGREIKHVLNRSPHARHPSDPRLDGIYATMLYDDLGTADGDVWQRSVTVFADGEVDRSPCGSGTSARLALLAGSAADLVLRHDSIIGTRFVGRVTGRTVAEDRPAVLTEVEGMAYETGTATFTLDPHDPLGTGFVLR